MSDDQRKAKEEPGPEEGARANYGIPGSPDTDTEGLMPLLSGSPEPATEPDASGPTDGENDAQGHASKFGGSPEPVKDADADEEASTGGAGPDEAVRIKF